MDDLIALVGRDDWTRLLGGWRDIADDTERLVRGLRALPADCACGDGQAHLRGTCPCCGGGGVPREPCEDCFRLVRTIGWKLDAVVDDALRYLDPVSEALTRHVGKPAHTEATRLRRELLALVHLFRAVEASAAEFRAGCRSRHLADLKALAEQVDRRVEDIDRLVDPTRGFARPRRPR